MSQPCLFSTFTPSSFQIIVSFVFINQLVGTICTLYKYLPNLLTCYSNMPMIISRKLCAIH